MDNLLNLIFPPLCIFCRKRSGTLFCDECLAKCELLDKGFCIVCGRESKGGITHKACFSKNIPTSLVCSYEYGGVVRECIRKAKYNSKQFAALRILAKKGVKVLSELGGKYYDNDLIVVPIPLSRKKMRSRGFNQARCIAQIVAQYWHFMLDDSILIRKKETAVQFSSNRKRRFENVKDAFAATADLSGKTVLLVDDICTSGATFLEASKALYNAQADEVKCFALSRKL